jgi:hypothetical protein
MAEYSIHVVDGISMEDPSGPAPPDMAKTAEGIKNLTDAIDDLTRRRLMEAAIKEDEANA